MGAWTHRRLLKKTMTILFFKRAIEDFRKNRLLNVVTLLTISLSILIVSAFILFFVNTREIMNFWKKGLRVMAYLKADIPRSELPDLRRQIQTMSGVENLKFISKEDAFNQLKAQMKRQASLFDNLVKNPLPDAFEIRLSPTTQDWETVELLATRIEALDQVEDVEYGQKWLGRFTQIFDLFTLTGYAMCTIFFMAAVFIMANTIRLVIYSRRDEIEIMRLVGAAERFIKIPFYIQGLLQGALGAGIALAVLFVGFLFMASNIERGFFSGLFNIQFLSPLISGAIILISVLVGWLGSYLSLKQYLKI
jgi:cell division transport system permease protein